MPAALSPAEFYDWRAETPAQAVSVYGLVSEGSDASDTTEFVTSQGIDWGDGGADASVTLYPDGALIVTTGAGTSVYAPHCDFTRLDPLLDDGTDPVIVVAAEGTC